MSASFKDTWPWVFTRQSVTSQGQSAKHPNCGDSGRPVLMVLSMLQWTINRSWCEGTRIPVEVIIRSNTSLLVLTPGYVTKRSTHYENLIPPQHFKVPSEGPPLNQRHNTQGPQIQMKLENSTTPYTCQLAVRVTPSNAAR